MSAEFVPLAELLRGRRTAHDGAAPSDVDGVRHAGASDGDVRANASDDEVRANDTSADSGANAGVAGDVPAAAADALRDARLFRARLADALDAAVPLLLRDIAVRVLARELRLAPCDVNGIVRATMACAPAVRVRVAPEDAPDASAGRASLVTVADPALQPGDAVIELDGGEIDARLGVRLALALEPFA